MSAHPISLVVDACTGIVLRVDVDTPAPAVGSVHIEVTAATFDGPIADQLFIPPPAVDG